MLIIEDTRAITFDLGDDQQPIPRAVRSGEFRPTTAIVHLDSGTGELEYVKVQGPVVGRGASMAAWIWYRRHGEWPPAGVPDVAVAAAEAAARAVR